MQGIPPDSVSALASPSAYANPGGQTGILRGTPVVAQGEGDQPNDGVIVSTAVAAPGRISVAAKADVNRSTAGQSVSS
jgi:hypothetical protein